MTNRYGTPNSVKRSLEKLVYKIQPLGFECCIVTSIDELIEELSGFDPADGQVEITTMRMTREEIAALPEFGGY